ncbi:DUF1127 domain-containing protein [Microvirga roseola]|uniref:DUF1127 domain-containing protein n=1 Tax=Microvirga roseola TaxID=2883126 RepID=UPI003898E85D
MKRLSFDSRPREAAHHREGKLFWPPPMRSIVRGMIAEWRIKRAIEELRRCSDHTLKDFGITRLEIECMVRHGRRRNRP